MPSQTINMHGKLYTLFDEKKRIESVAQAKAQEIRDNGQVAFLNPQTLKGVKINFWIYVAEKSIRRTSSRKNVSSKILLEEYKKGTQSFGKFMKELEKAQKEIPKNLAINELAKETPKKTVPKKKATKKVVSKKSNKKKVVSKKKSTKKDVEKPLLIN